MAFQKGTKYELGRAVKSVTYAPNWFLKMTGFFDAKRGETVALAQLGRYLEKCTSIENEECLAAEAFLKQARAEGAQELATIAKYTTLIPGLPGAVEENKPWDILENRARANAARTATAAVENAKERLYLIHEIIVNGSSILDERITKIRKKAGVKMNAYLKGLRIGGLASFDPFIEFSEKAAEVYYKKHVRLDEAIEKAAKAPDFEEEEAA